jgi:hypothetical protein|tara:strand:- start:2010 stop:2369 length:360 start_codon:yes stop_codon:yes gene_type:complete
MSEKNAQENSWEGLVSQHYLKAEDLKENTTEFAILGQERREMPDGSVRLHLELSCNKKSTENGLDKWGWTCNKTNASFLQNAGLERKDLVGKKIVLSKIKVTNPQTRKEVDSLRISLVA